jgi:hypothetical protein
MFFWSLVAAFCKSVYRRAAKASTPELRKKHESRPRHHGSCAFGCLSRLSLLPLRSSPLLLLLLHAFFRAVETRHQ